MPMNNVQQGPGVVVADPDLVWLSDCQIGADTRIGPFVGIEKGCSVGARCEISANTNISGDVVIEDDVFIGAGVSFTRTLFPGTSVATPSVTIIKRGAAIGSNATIIAGVVIGSGAMVGAGAVVTRNVPDKCLVAGVPARVIGSVPHRVARRDAYHRARRALLQSVRLQNRAHRRHH